MQVQDPQYIFRKRLAGTWKSKDSSCTVILDVYSYLEITYGGTRLSSSYSVLETNALYEANSKAMTGFFMGLTPAYKRHPGEELKVQMDNTSLSDDISNLYTVSSLWFGGEKLNIELTDSSNGQTTALVLTREGAEVEPAETAYVCECGYTGPFGKFCPNCGRAVKKNTHANVDIEAKVRSFVQIADGLQDNSPCLIPQRRRIRSRSLPPLLVLKIRKKSWDGNVLNVELKTRRISVRPVAQR